VIPPITYLITSGATTRDSTVESPEFKRILNLVASAVEAQIDLVQLREKNLTTRALYKLASRAAQLTRGSATRVLVNDRADVARAAGCDGVQLTAQSIEPSVIRAAFGETFLIGSSVHSLEEALAARDGGANFAVFGPVFDTPSKRAYGAPLGLELVREAVQKLGPFPLVAIGGIASDNVKDVLRAGARGVAAIRLFHDPATLKRTAAEIADVFRSVEASTGLPSS
jgi:thiamine-phosphate pyrophosphorylase